METQGKGEQRETSVQKSPEALFLDTILERIRPAKNDEIGTWVIGLVSGAVQGYSQKTTAQIACQKGCNHCCRFMVAVNSAEAIAIYKALILYISGNELESLKDKIAARVLQTSGMNQQQYWETTRDDGCVFLNSEGACSIYPIRPRACSSLLVSDVTPCREHSGTINRHAIPQNVATIGYIALSKELKRRGLQSGIYELNTALHTLFSDATAADRWAKGEEIFTGNMNPKLDEHIHLEVI